MKDLRERVFAALNRAKENGYDQTAEDPELVVCDLIACSDEFESLRDDEMADLQDYIIEWQGSFTT
jgi:hypothetical protein